MDMKNGIENHIRVLEEILPEFERIEESCKNNERHPTNAILSSHTMGERALRDSISSVKSAISELKEHLGRIEKRRADELNRPGNGPISVATVKDIKDRRFKYMKTHELADACDVSEKIVDTIQTNGSMWIGATWWDFSKIA